MIRVLLLAALLLLLSLGPAQAGLRAMNHEFHDEVLPAENTDPVDLPAENTDPVDQDSCPTDAALMLGTDVECYFTACDQGGRRLGPFCGKKCKARRKARRKRIKKWIKKTAKKVGGKAKEHFKDKADEFKEHKDATLNPFNDDFHPGGGCPVTFALPSDSGKACNYCLVQE